MELQLENLAYRNLEACSGKPWNGSLDLKLFFEGWKTENALFFNGGKSLKFSIKVNGRTMREEAY